ncbi:MAG TPA: sugar ABC transporter permease [Candidatus Merdivicinus excrementipullorum]|uniref:Sugar ABC transporter permease n=1 Tax=Candidatus Merdivicinus excrementipullorum TaxID=2840867 RepID=A0A9D1FM35_9FIRM|nr:sugar ABC transporter permease [Candidatus Merdivicinus excrementipullorum]
MLSRTAVSQEVSKKVFWTAKRKRNLKENIILYLILSPVLIHIFIFCYIPMYGVVIAFQNYFPGSPFIAFDGSVEWVGLQHFTDFIGSIYFLRLIKNTVVLSGLQLLIGFGVPIVFALLLNEVKNVRYKKFVQTASYLPHFISMVVVASLALLMVSQDGLINQLLAMMGLSPINYSTDPKYFPWVYVITNVWSSFGWNSIIYLSTIASIDPNLYEAARMDGANRFQQAIHITLPSIRNTIIILFIFAVGGLLNANTEFILLMYNPTIYETADVIGTYVYREGILNGGFSKATAIGIFMQVINFSLLWLCNTISRKINGYSMW